MGAWAYCHKCGDGSSSTPIGPPDVRDVLRGAVACWSCGTNREVDSVYKDELLVQMHEDITELKNTVAVLTKAVKLMADGALGRKTELKAPRPSAAQND